MKAFILSALILASSVCAEDFTDPNVQIWHKEQAASQARAMVKFSELINDAKSGFLKHCDDEIAIAEKNNDPILLKPDWSERIGERVVEKFFKDRGVNGAAAYTDDELMVKIKGQRGSRPQNPPPNHVLPSPLVGSWYYQGRFYRGTLFKISADVQKVYVTSDWDNYNGSWLNLSDLDTSTRILLNVATPKEKESYTAEQKAREEAAKQSAIVLAQMQERLAVQRAAERAAQNEAQKLAVQQEIARLLAEQNALLAQQQQGNINIIYAPGR